MSRSMRVFSLLCERLKAKLLRDIELGRVDPDILPLLSLLWSRGYCTTSSCSGRIVVKSGETPWSKPGVRILASWHLDPPSPRVVYHAALSGRPYSWVSAEPPLVALYARSLEDAEVLAKAAVRSGFKYTGYRLAGGAYYVVVRGEEKIEHIVVAEGRPTTPEPEFEGVYRLLLSVWKRGKERLARLLEALASL